MNNRYPELKIRIQSTFIDALLMLALMMAAATVLDKINPSQEEEDGWIRGVLFIAIWGMYEPVAMTFGCTLGNYLMKIRARKNSDTSKRIDILQACVRFIIKLLLGWISFLTIHSNKEKRAIHDLATGTVMIEKG